MKRYKIAFLVSHPIQYLAPLFRELAKEPALDLGAYYCSEEGARLMRDRGFGKEIKWDIPLLDGYRYKFLKNYSPSPSIFSGFFGLMNFGILNEFKKERYDHLIVCGWNYFTYVFAILAAKILRKKVLLRGENPLSHELLAQPWKRFIKKILLGYGLFKLIDVFLYIGEENKKFYEYYGVPKGRLVFSPYCVENERLIKSYRDLIGRKEALKEELGIPREKVVVLFSGKLIDKKRPLDLLMAYETLTCGNKALLYVGDGALASTLLGYVKMKGLKDVYFLGFRNQSEMPKYYSISDILALPSTVGESWGLVVNEAMCFRLPVVVSDLVGCSADLVKKGENGFIFKTGDVPELASRLKALIENPDMRHAMGERSFEIIEKWNYRVDVENLTKALGGLT